MSSPEFRAVRPLPKEDFTRKYMLGSRLVFPEHLFLRLAVLGSMVPMDASSIIIIVPNLKGGNKTRNEYDRRSNKRNRERRMASE